MHIADFSIYWIVLHDKIYASDAWSPLHFNLDSFFEAWKQGFTNVPQQMLAFL